MGRMEVGRQTNKQEHPAIKQGVQIVLSKYTIAAFLIK